MRCTGAVSTDRDQPPIASVLTPPHRSRAKGTGSAMAQILVMSGALIAVYGERSGK